MARSTQLAISLSILAVVTRLDAGESPADVKKSLRMPPKAAARFVADAQRLDRDRLRRAIEVMADLEMESRGGRAAMSEDTAALRAITAIAA